MTHAATDPCHDRACYTVLHRRRPLPFLVFFPCTHVVMCLLSLLRTSTAVLIFTAFAKYSLSFDFYLTWFSVRGSHGW